jgi:hypothetical protein
MGMPPDISSWFVGLGGLGGAASGTLFWLIARPDRHNALR